MKKILTIIFLFSLIILLYSATYQRDQVARYAKRYTSHSNGVSLGDTITWHNINPFIFQVGLPIYFSLCLCASVREFFKYPIFLLKSFRSNWEQWLLKHFLVVFLLFSPLFASRKVQMLINHWH